jgi:uncharacterized membrane protein
MSPEIGQAATRLALFLIVASLLALIWVDKGSAEFVVSVLTIFIGLALLGVVALLARMGTARFPKPPARDEEEGLLRRDE